MEKTSDNLDDGFRSDKEYTTAVILSCIFGMMGIHHFYLNRWGVGFFDLGLFIATIVAYISGHFIIAGLLFVIDLVHTVWVTYLLFTGQYRDGQGRFITYPGQTL